MKNLRGLRLDGGFCRLGGKVLRKCRTGKATEALAARGWRVVPVDTAEVLAEGGFEGDRIDAVTCWLLDVTRAKTEALARLKAMGLQNGEEHRLAVQTLVYRLADRVLKPGGVLQLVDRTREPIGEALAARCACSERSRRARAWSSFRWTRTRSRVGRSSRCGRGRPEVSKTASGQPSSKRRFGRSLDVARLLFALAGLAPSPRRRLFDVERQAWGNNPCCAPLGRRAGPRATVPSLVARAARGASVTRRATAGVATCGDGCLCVTVGAARLHSLLQQERPRSRLRSRPHPGASTYGSGAQGLWLMCA